MIFLLQVWEEEPAQVPLVIANVAKEMGIDVAVVTLPFRGRREEFMKSEFLALVNEKYVDCC